jgi:hypothetical protein
VDDAPKRVRMISAAEAKRLIERGRVTVIDVGEIWQVAERARSPARATSRVASSR